METKEIRIEVPEGYEIDNENTTSDCIRFKKIKTNCKPKSWDEYEREKNDTPGYSPTFATSWISNPGAVAERKLGVRYDVFKTPEEAKAFRALGKLIQLRDEWWGDWKPTWSVANSEERKFVITNDYDVLHQSTRYKCNCILTFPTAEMANEFYNAFKDLIKEAKMFI